MPECTIAAAPNTLWGMPVDRSLNRQDAPLAKFRAAGAANVLSLHELRLAVEEAQKHGTPDEVRTLQRALRAREALSR